MRGIVNASDDDTVRRGIVGVPNVRLRSRGRKTRLGECARLGVRGEGG